VAARTGDRAQGNRQGTIGQRQDVTNIWANTEEKGQLGMACVKRSTALAALSSRNATHRRPLARV
jgi:hypothetical protein